MTADSRDLELLVAKIQQQLAPKAEVLHDVKLDGRQSKTKRQIDVLVRENIGQYEIRIIIDCKDYKKPVDVKGVEEFYGLLHDVGAHKGVLVCPKGFSEAAKTRYGYSQMAGTRDNSSNMRFPQCRNVIYFQLNGTSSISNTCRFLCKNYDIRQRW
jgi:hypothetical protein